jgi:glycosyltransferase involved in cell wall biosynthesis
MTTTIRGDKPLRILFVAQAVSIHTARWIGQLRDQGWDLHLFDMLGSFPHAELGGITEYSLLFPRKVAPLNGKPSYGHSFFLSRGWDPFPVSLAGFFIRRLFRGRTKRLANLIQRLQPDVIHSMELQTESYHLLDAIRMLGGRLGAPWIVTTWGSDIFYYQRFPEHLDKIKQLLQKCDYLIPDCSRDVALARDCGFAGDVPLILPGSGGYPVEEMRRFITGGSPSDRRVIVLKGYEGWAGRALTAVTALEMCADVLHDYEIVVYAASPAVLKRLGIVQEQRRLRITALSRSPHRTMLELFGRSRIALAVNVTDGVPNAMLEAMTMGAFPIQSDTQSTSEWITEGANGLLVNPNDPESVAAAIRRAIRDDGLINAAAAHNLKLITERLDLNTVRPRVIEMYRTIGARRESQRQ